MAAVLRTEAGKTETDASIHGVPARLTGGGGRGEHGGDDGADRSVLGSRSRRRRAAAPELGLGHGGIRVRAPAAGEKGGGEGEQVEGVLLYPPRGARERGGGRGGHRRTAAMAPVLPLAPQWREG